MRHRGTTLAPVDVAPLRWVAPAAVAFGVALLAIPPLSLVGWGSPRDAVTGVVATAVLAPPYAWLLAIGVRLVRLRWVLPAFLLLAAVTVAATLILRAGEARLLWLPQFSAVAVASVVAFRGRAGAATSAGFVIVPVAASALTGAPVGYAVVVAMQESWRLAAVLVVVWLAAALRILRSTREELVDQTRAAEQARMDHVLQRTVGAALDEVARRGADLLQNPHPDPDSRLRGLIAEARLGLVEARRIIGAYQTTSLSDELQTAAALLAAAGTPTGIRMNAGRIVGADVLRVRTGVRDAVRTSWRCRPHPPRARSPWSETKAQKFALWSWLSRQRPSSSR